MSGMPPIGSPDKKMTMGQKIWCVIAIAFIAFLLAWGTGWLNGDEPGRCVETRNEYIETGVCTPPIDP